MYKPSRYNLQVVDPQGRALWFNTASGAHLLLKPESQRLFQAWLTEADALVAVLEGPEGSTRRLAQQAVDKGFFVDAANGELARVLARLEQGRWSSTHRALTLSLSPDCNLACPYCFASGARGRGPMKPSVREALYAWWEGWLQGASSYSLDWIGGEPLLYLDVLLEVGKAIMARAQAAGLTLKGHDVTTNGLLLTEDAVQALKALGVKRVQLTLDGGPETHDQLRGLPGGGATFEAVLAGVKRASPHLETLVRVNLTEQTAPTVPALLDRLKAEGVQAQVYPARVFQAHAPCGSGLNGLLTPQGFEGLEVEFWLAAMERGFAPPGLPTPCYGGYCGAYGGKHYGVDSEGFLYRCATLLEQPARGAVGSVLRAPTGEEEARQAAYAALGPEEARGCHGCEVLPVCLGGCPQTEGGMGPEGRCSPLRYSLRSQLVVAHELYRATKEEQ